MKICVTGSSGFIGKALCKQLLKYKHDILATSRYSNLPDIKPEKNLKFIQIEDINIEKKWPEILSGVECIIHCAARAHIMNDNKVDSLSLYQKVNVEGTRKLAEQASIAGVKRLIFLSSIKVNGELTKKSFCFRHADIPFPEDAYGISKWEAEQVLWEISRKSGLEIVIIRPPLVYGPGVKGNFLRLLNLVKRNVPIPLATVDNYRSFIGIDNLVDLLIRCTDHPGASGQTFLVSDGEDLSTPTLIKKISSAMGKKNFLFPVPISLIKFIGRMVGKSSEVDRLLSSLQIDSSLVYDKLGWKPPLNSDEGLLKMIKWYLNNK